MEKYDEFCKRNWEKWQNEKTNVNILLLGNTGSGKSSMINKCLGVPVASTSDYSRGTTEFQIYNGSEYGLKINFIDSMGYEIGDGESKSEKRESIFAEKIKNYVSTENKKGTGINAAWYCISIDNSRIEPTDLDVIKSLSEYEEIKGRVCVLLTKCDNDESGFPTCTEFTRLIHQRVPNIEVFRTSTVGQYDEYMQFGKLLEWTEGCLTTEDQKIAFRRSQEANLSIKKEHMYKEIAGFSAAAALIGAIPIPFSDAAALTLLQISMAQRIMIYYGIPSKANTVKEIAGNAIISGVGKTLAGSILKAIPGIGSVIGGAINAGVASTITAAMGLTISNICHKTCVKIANGEQVNWNDLFNVDFIKPVFESFLKNKKELDKVDLYKNDQSVIDAGKTYVSDINEEIGEAE